MNFNFIYITASGLAVLGAFFGFTFTTTQTEVPTSISTTSQEQGSVVCANTSDSFNQDESQVLASHYSNSATADCLFVGCGGIL